MMFNVSACDIRERPTPSNDDHNKTAGNISRKKHQRLRTEEGDEQDHSVLARGKKVRNNNSEFEAGSSSSDNNSSFIALVTASNLKDDTLYLPQDCTSSTGLNRKCSNIILTDGGDRSWELDLRFNKSTESFYITRGWRHFCDENGKKVGSLFTFELMIKKGETPVLSFCPSKTTINHATLTNSGRFVTKKLANDSVKRNRLYLSLKFLKRNGLEEPRTVTLLGRDGTRRLANLLQETSGRMSLGKGWKEFYTANDLKVGEVFTLESIWDNATPILKLCKSVIRQDREILPEASEEEYVSTESSIGKEPEEDNNIEEDINATPILKLSKSVIRQDLEKISEASEEESVSTESSIGKEPEKDNNIDEDINNSSSLIDNRTVILVLAPEVVNTSTLYLPSEFMKANGIDRLGKIVMLGKNEMEWWWGYLLSKGGLVAVDCGWSYFCETNGVKIGDSFRLEFMYKYEATPVLKFSPNYSRE